jgi:hypothetical protein
MEEVDKEDITDEEADLMFGYANNGQDTTKLDLINDYLPEKQDYSAKTVLSEEHPEIMAAIENLTGLYPEIAHMEDTLVQFVLAFEKRQISVEGRSRQEFLDILAGLSGGNARDFNEREETIKSLLTPKNEGDDE